MIELRNEEARHVMWFHVDGVLTPLPPFRLERTGVLSVRASDVDFLDCHWHMPSGVGAANEESADG